MRNKIHIIIEIFNGAKWGWIFSLTAIVLIVTSFILPPTGVIDSSVLAAVGEIFAFAALYKIPEIVQSVRNGKSLTLKHGETEVTVESKNED